MSDQASDKVATLPVPKVYSAIAEVIGDLAEIGVSKGKRNQEQNYMYRGIDDVYNALAPVLAKRKLLIIPNELERTVTEKRTSNGRPIYLILLKVELRFISAEDGSSHSMIVFGEGLDMQDKGTSKALSSAYKYAVITSLAIPVEGVVDTDSSSDIDLQPSQPYDPRDDRPIGSRSQGSHQAGYNVPATTQRGSNSAVAANSKGKQQSKKKDPPPPPPLFTPEEMADLAMAVDEANDDVAAKAVCVQVYKERARIPANRLKEISLAAITRRSQLVPEEMLGNFEANIEEFVKQDMLDQQAASVVISEVRSRLNLPQK